MKPLNLNFSDYSYQRDQKRKIIMVVFLAIILGLIINEYWTLKDEVLSNANPEQRKPAVSGQITLSRQQLAEIDLTRKLVTELNAPWLKMIQAVESIKEQNRQTFFTLFEPNVRKGEILFSGQSDSIEDLVQFMNDLNQESLFSNALLMSQHRSEDDPDVIHFNLKVRWHSP